MFKHRILNLITIISVLIVLALPVYSKYILFPSYNTFLINQAKSILRGIARNMMEHNNLKQSISRASPLPRNFINDVEHIRKTTGLWKVKIFTPEGQIAYSTGLLNRRGFVRELEKQLQTATRSRCTLFLLFLDLNDFKKINDEFGHETGVTTGRRPFNWRDLTLPRPAPFRSRSTGARTACPSSKQFSTEPLFTATLCNFFPEFFPI